MQPESPAYKQAQARAVACIDALRGELIDSVSEVVRIPSVSPNYPGCRYEDLIGGELAANRALGRQFERAGCVINWVEAADQRPNLVGVIPGSDPTRGRSLILAGHVDTVPGGDPEAWTGKDPFSGQVIDGRIYGRGAADQKAGLVAQGIAALALRQAGVRLKGDLLLESLVGEEVGEHGNGVSGVIEAGYVADGAIVSEPTGPPAMNVAPVSAGLLWMTLHVTGKAGHNNLRPELVRAGGLGEVAGVNAIEKGTYLLGQLQVLEQQWGFSKSHPLFRPGHFTLHPGVIEGGAAQALVPFFISEYCTIDYSILYPPNEPVEDIKREIEDFVVAAGALDPWLKRHPARLEWRLDWEPLRGAADSEICKVAARATIRARQLDEAQASVDVVRGFSAVCDATYFAKAGIPAVVLGPGSILAAHAVDESIDVDEVVSAAKAFAIAAIDWCGLA